ncbi:extracellular metalloproteinase [Sessilibacter corallicola]|uniref:extracellular metalloproteinase n=1 Tax=Sessilibacter corallicola TaxID=2904075 RepID=UPI001E58C4F2|nr:M36 family metallopeptidase [Sessilibacter corallicola]
MIHNAMTSRGKKRFNFPHKKSFKILSLSLLSLAISNTVFAQVGQTTFNRDIDNRPTNVPRTAQKAPSALQMQAINAMRQQSPNLMTTFSEFGATRTLTNAMGNLTGPSANAGNPNAVARAFVNRNMNLLGLVPSDVRAMQVTDVVESISGVTHFYFGQTFNGVPVYNGQMQVHVTKAGAISHVNNGFIPELAKSIKSMTPVINAQSAVSNAARELNIPMTNQPVMMEALSDAQSSVMISQQQLSPKPFKASLVLVPIAPGNVTLAWNFQFEMDHAWPNVTIDAETGALLTSFDLMKDASYRVYPEPVESPIHTTPLPPNDARQLVVDPEDPTASPNGWFNAGTNIMVGNNAHACADRNGNNACDTPEVACASGQVCDFPLNLNSDPVNSLPAAITNLFYWSNLIHDVQYQYGFDESGGNFQENNFGRGGFGSDSVNAEAQDNAAGGSNCNANFATPADGSNPRMQMFLCDESNPSADGDFDNGVIAHEYGHGISTRQVGGPSNSSCLNNSQQGGEGWSDWFGLVYTARPSDLATDVRGIGAYLFNLPPTGTIRPQQYSTDPAVNNYTYESVRGSVIPHGVGSVWAQALWEVYWALVDEHGFESDLINFDLNDANEAGNKRALFYVNEGLKNTACSPTFTDARDGIITAVANSFGGEDMCTVWNAFAAYGLGVDAISGGSNSTNPTNGFAVPAQCSSTPPPVAQCSDGSEPLYVADFETSADGWFTGSNTCTTGAFTLGTPNLITASGVTTQVGGAFSGNSAWFTQPNTAAGTADVDGGTCEAFSPSVNLAGIGAVDIELMYFHGQRDAGDDATDGFTIDVLNNGSVVDSLVNIGDVVSNAAWTPASTVLNNPGNVQLRVRATDGAGAGDLIEAGVDRVLFCAADATPPPPPPAGCVVEEDFETDAGGWSNSAASTCSTGAFVLGTPTEIVNGGVTTQVGGANSGINAIFTATNTSAGVNDVDGGTCIAESPSYSVPSNSTLSVAYFHGQRDSGGDAGDFFRLEVSTDGGVSFQTLASNGDTTSNAAWQTATRTIPGGSDVIIRTQCSDGTAGGDLVECGIDDVSICPL